VTLLDRLGALYPETSRRRLREWIQSGRVTVNAAPVRDVRATVAESDRVALGARGPSARAGPAPFPAALRLVHEDEDLLVIHKPPGLLTIATERERERTAYRLIWDYLAAQRPPRRPFIVHRLDRDTSGLVVVAKSPEAKRHLQAQFEARTAERDYVAVVEGRVRAAAGTLESRLLEEWTLRVRPGASGKLAVTHYQVLRRRHDTTVLALHLGTGRRHQIRVQLAESGHPIAGDRAHGSRRDPFGRLALHACRLGFEHPATGQRVSFESAPPAGWV
jgi:23S rRNA pseudouridine1911/1915/1917 synthase